MTEPESPRSIHIYHRYQQYEWATKYFCIAGPEHLAARALTIATAEADLVHSEVIYNRYEIHSGAGVKLSEGTFTSLVGAGSGDIEPIKWCAHIRLVSNGPLRPSTKFIHGITESAATGGEAASGFLSLIAAYGDSLAAADVADSQGFPVTDALFRQFSRRRRMRRIP